MSSTAGTMIEGVGNEDVVRDFQAAARMSQVVRKGREVDDPLSELQFAAQLNFLLTIGYLTEEQAAALFNWSTTGAGSSCPA